MWIRGNMLEERQKVNNWEKMEEENEKQSRRRKIWGKVDEYY